MNKQRAHRILVNVWGCDGNINKADACWLSEQALENETLLDTAIRVANLPIPKAYRHYDFRYKLKSILGVIG